MYLIKMKVILRAKMTMMMKINFFFKYIEGIFFVCSMNSLYIIVEQNKMSILSKKRFK